MDRDALIAAAISVRERAYARYSLFSVGAALWTDSGDIVTGCNVENASYGLTICAERNAIGSAIASGHRRFQAMALVTAGGVTPCGACRQVLAEFCDDLQIWIVDANHVHDIREVTLSVLLPGRFTF